VDTGSSWGGGEKREEKKVIRGPTEGGGSQKRENEKKIVTACEWKPLKREHVKIPKGEEDPFTCGTQQECGAGDLLSLKNF